MLVFMLHEPGPASTQPRAQIKASFAEATDAMNTMSFTESLGGTLVVSNASFKESVHTAVKEGNLSFGFSAGGCLFPYYIGVSGALRDGQLLGDHVKIGGSSAGALLAACLKSGMGMDQITSWSMRLMDDCRRHGTRGRLGEVLATALREGLPADAHTRVKDLAYIGVSKAFPVLQPMLLSQFEDREDLIAALLSSCHIPYWLDMHLFTQFRGSYVMDGGMTNFIPIPPGTTGVRICCFPSRQLSPIYRIGISPDSFTSWPHSLAAMVGWAMQPADEDTVVALIDKGRADALAWMESMELGAEARAARTDAGEVGDAKRTAIDTHAGKTHVATGGSADGPAPL